MGLLAMIGLPLGASADSEYLVDTGPGANTGGRTLSATQFLAGQFTIEAGYEVESLEGWMIYPTILGDLPVEAVLYGEDETGLPDPDQELHRQLFTVPASGIPFAAGWYGVGGLALPLDPGTYWLAFEVPTADFGSGAMPPTPLEELEAYAIDSGAGYAAAGGSSADWIGIRVLPEPGSALGLVVGAIAIAAGAGRRRSGLALGLVLLASGLPAEADWSDEFDAGLSAAWVFAATDDAGDPPSTGVTTAAIVEAGADDHLLLAHSTTAIRDGGGGATDVFGYVPEVFSDMAISADVNASPAAGQQSWLGVIARGDPNVGSAYLAAVDFADSRFAIARSDDFIDFQNPLALDDTVSIDPGTTYHIQFFLVGSTLTARLLDATTRTLLSTITVVDGSYAAGAAGLIVETDYDGLLNPVAPVVGTFDSVAAVPEPGGAIALAIGSLGVFRLAGRARRERSDIGQAAP